VTDTPNFTFQPIGHVESPYKEKFGTPRQPGLVEGTRGTIVLRDDLNPDAFDGLADFSHVWVVFVFHENQSVREGRPTVKTKVHPPRLEGKAVGVFATRSPHRPNPIGLSLVRIEKIEGRRLSIYGLDLIDGTPVLDLKPYLPTIEAIPGAYEGWSGPIKSKSIAVEWSPEAEAVLRSSDHQIDLATAKATIEQILELDPRPVSYRGTLENPDPYTSLYGFRFENWNIVFRMLSATPEDPAKRARIERIEPWDRPTTAV
jgi:tRNA (adenine37-N6)-methyltransferase